MVATVVGPVRVERQRPSQGPAAAQPSWLGPTTVTQTKLLIMKLVCVTVVGPVRVERPRPSQGPAAQLVVIVVGPVRLGPSRAPRREAMIMA